MDKKIKKLRFYQSVLIMVSLVTSVVSLAKPIPVSDFFKENTVISPRISPNGKYFSAAVKKDGNYKLVTLNLKNNKLIGVLSLRNHQDASSHRWVNDERIIIRPNITSGSLDSPRPTGELLAVNYNGRLQKPLVDSASGSNQSGGIRYRQSIIDRLIHNKKFVLVQQTTFDGLSDIYKVNVYSGKRHRVGSVPGKFSSVIVDNNHKPRFAVGSAVDKDTKQDLTVVYYKKENSSDWQLIQKLDEKEVGLRPIAFTKDNKKVYVYMPLGSKNGLQSGVYLYDPTSQKKSLIWANKSITDISSMVWDNDVEKSVPIGVKLDDGIPHYEFFDNNHPLAKIYAQFEKLFSGQFFRVTNYTDDGKLALIVSYSDKNPGKLYSFNFKTNKLKYVLSFKPQIKPSMMGTEQAISYKTRDGLTIYGYLTLPKGKSKNLPMVLKVHGGPYGIRDYWGFDSEDQFLASRGYAVLKVNYRGSGGYGSHFQYSAYRQMGAQMQDDLTDATHWAIKKGIADKNRICIYGGSYGGYAALMGVVKEPDLYKCAIPYAGVYDIGIQRRKSDTRRSDRGRRFLDEAWNADDENFIKARSAYYHLDKIKAALFFAHGEDDPRVPIENYEEVAKKLKEMHYPFEHLIIDREPHGFYLEKNRIKFYSMMARFLDKHIGH